MLILNAKWNPYTTPKVRAAKVDKTVEAARRACAKVNKINQILRHKSAV